MKNLFLIFSLFCAIAVNAASIKTSDISDIENTIYGIDATVDADGTAVMSICMKNNFPVPGFQFDIVIPEGFYIPTDEKGFYLIDLSTERTTNRETNTFDSAIQSDGSVRVLAASTSLATFDGNDGEVCTITFKTKGNIAPGEYTVTLKNIVISDVTGHNEVKPEPTTATLTVNNYDVTCEAVQDDVNPADFYATFSNNVADVELHAAADASLTVYDVTVSGSTLVLTSREGNTKVARGEAVLVKTSYNTFTASPLSGSSLTPAEYGTTTLLLATPSEAQTVSCDAAEAKLYRLTYYDIDTKTGLGFYWGNSDGTQIKAKPGKGYLKVPTSQAAEIKGFRINPLPTHVDGIDAEVQGSDEPIYDLSGRRVENPTSGIYLQNNKKIIVK